MNYISSVIEFLLEFDSEIPPNLLALDLVLLLFLGGFMPFITYNSLKKQFPNGRRGILIAITLIIYLILMSSLLFNMNKYSACSAIKDLTGDIVYSKFPCSDIINNENKYITLDNAWKKLLRDYALDSGIDRDRLVRAVTAFRDSADKSLTPDQSQEFEEADAFAEGWTNRSISKWDSILLRHPADDLTPLAKHERNLLSPMPQPQSPSAITGPSSSSPPAPVAPAQPNLPPSQPQDVVREPKAILPQRPTPSALLGAGLIPGSADVIHDILGIAIGMSCDQGIVLSKNVSTTNRSAENNKIIRFVGSRGEIKINKSKTAYSFTKYEVILHADLTYGRGGTQDVLDFYCLEDGGRRPIFAIKRHIRFLDPKTAPTLETLVGIFQEKYGNFSVKFSPRLMAIMFDRSGLIESQQNDCANYQNGNLYTRKDEGFADADDNNCSYIMIFHASEAREPPGATSNLDIEITDFLRLENAVRSVEAHRLETTPVDKPKL